MKLTARGSGRLLLTVLAVVAMASTTVACSSSAPQTTNAPGQTAQSGPPAPGLEKFYSQKLSWGSCADFAPSLEDKAMYSDPKTGVECAWLDVPLEYANPGGKDAQLAVLRVKASNQAQRIGSLLVNPGGPGGSGTSTAISVAKQSAGTQVPARFDLIGFDPRGVGASKPTIQCFTPAERDADRLDVEVDNSPAGVAKQEGKAKDYDSKCLQRSTKELLANAGTRDVAKDMDILRQALGDQKLTYLGYSYGTRLGSTYAEEFPQNVRALVLDGALDPNQSLIDRQVAQAGGFQGAFNAFAANCAKDPTCPLGTNPDPKAATAAFRKLALPTIDKPISLEDGRKLSYNDVMTGTIQALYTPELWRPLTIGLQQLKQGQGRVLMLLADLYQGRQDDGTYQLTLDAFTSIGCVDDKAITDRNMVLEASKRALAAAPFEDTGHGPSPALDPCAFWPVANTSEPHEPKVTGLPPVLVVSVTGDPATPYQAGVNLAKALSGRLLSVEGNQHTVALQGTKCVDDIVSDYLVDLKLPDDGSRCTIPKS
jgi:pimeloyl-ACP methyl ester carboxylesterase